MKQKSISDLGTLQKQVMDIIWETGRASVHQVRDELTKNRPLAYTTILSVMQKLEKAGWLTHYSEGRTYIYVPAVSRKQAGIQSIRDFITRICSGDNRTVIQYLIDDEAVTDEELQEIQKMIKERRKELKK